MSDKADITKYFNEGSKSKSGEFFDHISTPRSAGSVQNQPARREPDEPVVCKLFTSNTKPSSGADASNFFDMLGSNLTPLSPTGVMDSSYGLGSQGLVTTGDILNSFKTYDENLTKPSRVSEAERSYNAWIVPEQTRRALISMVTSPPGTFVPDREQLTMPGVVLEEEMKDTVYEAVHHYLGQSEAAKRKVLTASEVTQDERGLRELIQAGCYRAAVNLTKSLLTIYGQGAGRAGHPSKHTVHSIQLWFTRLALLVKLRSFSLAAVEAEPFGDLDRPDMFFQFYPELHGGRLGSLVPFSFRLLVAQIPGHMEKHQKSLTKLHLLLATIRKMLGNLDKGLLEDGSPCQLTAADRADSTTLWRARENRVLHSIVNTALAFKDYSMAIEVMQILISRETRPLPLGALQSSLGRILLQLGDVTSSEKLFAEVKAASQQVELRDLIDSGLLLVAQNLFQEAFSVFEQAAKIEPNNVLVLNNMSVCLLYLGRLKESVILLERALRDTPSLALHESLLLNLCTLYELQSSHCLQAKLRLLSLLSHHKGDGVNISCLKLQM